MLGVILCGGKSTRMGSDKGLLKALLPPDGENMPAYKAGTWAQNAIDKINCFQIPVVLSVNKNQYEEYSSVFSPQLLVTDNDSLKMNGPLCGILNVHLTRPGEDMLVLACDMPLMETELIKELLMQYNLNLTSDAFIYTNDGETEPLPGIYKASGLAHIHHLYITGRLPRHSMKYMLEHIATHTLILPEDKKKAFMNFNAHADLNGL
jgi:molybdopterin-guanine dinucleotide biosynthesis protein A